MLHAVLRPGNPVGNTHQGYRKLVFFGVIWYITPAGNLLRIRVLVYFQVMFIGNPFFAVFFVIQVYCHVNPIPLKKGSHFRFYTSTDGNIAVSVCGRKQAATNSSIYVGTVESSRYVMFRATSYVFFSAAVDKSIEYAPVREELPM